MKIAFFGTGEFSRNILNSIYKNNDLEVSFIVSQVDKPIGRKKILTPTPIKQFAIENNIFCLQPETLKNNTDFFEYIKKAQLDFIIVVAYGKIIPSEILRSTKYGCINIHGSILPKYRGASPIQESIKRGDNKTGLTIMYMSEGMDEGDILKTQEVSIDRDDNTIDIFKKFENIGPSLLISTLKQIVSGDISATLQNESEATYCSKISKNDGKINFNQTAKEIYDQYKAYTPWPGVFHFYKGKKINIEICDFIDEGPELDEDFKIGDVIEFTQHGKDQIGILCSSGIFFLKQIKLEGKKSMDIFSFINGNKDFLEYTFND